MAQDHVLTCSAAIFSNPGPHGPDLASLQPALRLSPALPCGTRTLRAHTSHRVPSSGSHLRGACSTLLGTVRAQCPHWLDPVISSTHGDLQRPTGVCFHRLRVFHFNHAGLELQFPFVFKYTFKVIFSQQLVCLSSGEFRI